MYHRFFSLLRKVQLTTTTKNSCFFFFPNLTTWKRGGGGGGVGIVIRMEIRVMFYIINCSTNYMLFIRKWCLWVQMYVLCYAEPLQSVHLSTFRLSCLAHLLYSFHSQIECCTKSTLFNYPCATNLRPFSIFLTPHWLVLLCVLIIWSIKLSTSWCLHSSLTISSFLRSYHITF